ncbi:recombination-associated protein RdgC [Niveibacterium terrae]|uniref:recombination-associated protein RdgC n=1 Tax=Niveibacterium terrae TaxID=3373598 RepID=UPI003A932164
MWFKNLQLYRLPAPWNIDLAKLEERLAKRPFQHCGSQDLATRGFSSPNRSDALVFASNQHWLIALGTEQKLLPASVVNQVAADRAEEIEAQQGFKPGRKQVKEIKEAVTQELLPRAFPRRRKTFAWIDPVRGWLVVDAASAAKADEVIETLREVLDELPLRLLDTEVSPSSAMADWLAGGDAPANFTIDRDCELRSVTEEKATVRYVHHPLEGEDIPKHLADGKVPTKLGLTFDERISFVLTERLEIKRLAFLDVIQEEAEKNGTGGDEQFEVDFVLMTAELARFLPHLVEALGGERNPV